MDPPMLCQISNIIKKLWRFDPKNAKPDTNSQPLNRQIIVQCKNCRGAGRLVKGSTAVCTEPVVCEEICPQCEGRGFSNVSGEIVQ